MVTVISPPTVPLVAVIVAGTKYVVSPVEPPPPPPLEPPAPVTETVTETEPDFGI
jgi:hypothetical protein